MKRAAEGSSSREPPTEKKKIPEREDEEEASSSSKMQEEHQEKFECVMELSAPFLRTRQLRETLAPINKACWKIAQKVYRKRLQEPFIPDDCPPAVFAQLPRTLEPIYYTVNFVPVRNWLPGGREPAGLYTDNALLRGHVFEHTDRSTVWKCTAPGHSSSGTCCRCSLQIPEQLLLVPGYNNANTNSNLLLSSVEMMHWSYVNGTIVVIARSTLTTTTPAPAQHHQGRINQDNDDGQNNVNIETWFHHFSEYHQAIYQLWGVVYDISQATEPTENTVTPSVVQPLTTPALNSHPGYLANDSYHGQTVRSANGGVLVVCTHFGKGQGNDAEATEFRFTVYNVGKDSITQRNQFVVSKGVMMDASPDGDFGFSLSVGGEMLSVIVTYMQQSTVWNVYDTRSGGMAISEMELDEDYFRGSFTNDHEFVIDSSYELPVKRFLPFCKSLVVV